MPIRFWTSRWMKGVGLCVLLLLLLCIYETLRVRRPEICRQDIQGLNPPLLLSTDRQGPLDQGKLVTVPSTDAHVSEYLNVVDPGSLSTNKDSCILTKTRTNPAFQICLYPRRLDIYISKSLGSSGVWEYDITRLFQKALRRFPQATVINVGANIGYYSLLAAAMGHPVIAVEPVKASMEKLAQGVQLNGFADKVRVLHNAVDDSHRIVSMGTDKRNQGGIAVLKNKTDQHLVKTIVMDDLIPLIHTRDVIIIMDIEVYECRAIAGSAKLFQHVNVTYIFMEWMGIHNYRHRPDTPCPIDVIRRVTEGHFDRLGYIAHDVGTNKVLDPHSSPDWQYHNVYWRYKDHAPLIP